MNPIDHFDKLFGDLKLSPDDAALYLFLAGWNSALREMAAHVKAMPFEKDTQDSFAVYFERQVINVKAMTK
jgi:hypothetical protein